MRAETINGVMTLTTDRRIDSANVAAAEAEIRRFLTQQQPSSLMIDAAALEYISSAGLRLILKLKKKYPDTKVVNVSPDVYEIFDVTGFTEILSVKRALRQLDVTGCEIIGEGAYGTVYRYNADTIVKVYPKLDSPDAVRRERELARKAFILGVPTAIPYDVVKVGGRYGAVFELLNAKSFAQLLREGESPEALAAQSVEILKIIHDTVIDDSSVPAKKPVACSWAERSARYLPAEIGDRLIALFDAIPETDNMLHGDFHVKNIMRQGDENLLIDMDTLSSGHPIYEMSAIFSAYEGFSAGNTDSCTRFLGISREQCRAFLDATFRCYYSSKSEKEIESLRRKAALISYTRIYRWLIEHYGIDSKEHRDAIAFCRNYLIENVPLTDNLYE